jgi:hypothetical protein
MVLAGMAQLMAFSSITYVLYHALPNWVMSRMASIYQLALQAAIVGGTVLWCVAADMLGIRIALFLTGISLIAGLATKVRFPLKAGNKEIDVTPSMHWPNPELIVNPEFEHGPVLVQIEYKIDSNYKYDFSCAMKDLGTIRKRDDTFLRDF